jgi:hypothetical protein
LRLTHRLAAFFGQTNLTSPWAESEHPMDNTHLAGDDSLTSDSIYRERFNNLVFALSMVAVMLGGIIAAGH